MHAANNVFLFLIQTLFSLYIGAFLVRILLAAARADFYNPISQFIVTITDPLLVPARKLIPSIGQIDTAAWLIAFLLQWLEIFLLYTLQGLSPTYPNALIQVLIELAISLVTILTYAIIIQAIMSWIAGPTGLRHPILTLLDQLTAPILRPIRKVIPPVAMVDLSPLVAIIGLSVLLIILRS